VQVERLDERLVRRVAPNGLRMLTEELPAVRSAAIGVWFRAGSAHEPADRMGLAHLLEHMVFKGSETRTAQAIAHELESRGGALDAFTSRDFTCYQAHLLDADLPIAVDVLTDLVRRPLLREADLGLERQVVLEEIRGVQDAPEDLVFELHGQALWPGHPYGRPILGSPDSLARISSGDLKAAHHAAYHATGCIIAAAGNVRDEALVELLGDHGWLEAPPGPAPEPVNPPAPQHGLRQSTTRDTQQVHIVLGTDTIAAGDQRRYALALIGNVLGGGMASRLFQRVREELGLAYAIYAFQHLFQQGGMCGVYVGTHPDSADLATEAILAEYQRLSHDGLTADELAAGKRQLKGQVVLGLESPMSRMHRLASSELMRDRYRRIDEVLAEIDAVTQDQILELCREFFAPERQTLLRLGKA